MTYISKIVSLYQNSAYCQVKVHWNFNLVCTDFAASSVTDELDWVAVSDSWCMHRIVLCVTISRLTQNPFDCGHCVKVITHLVIVPRLIMHEVLPPFLSSQYNRGQTVTVPAVPSLSHLEWMLHSSGIFSVVRGRIYS